MFLSNQTENTQFVKVKYRVVSRSCGMRDQRCKGIKDQKPRSHSKSHEIGNSSLFSRSATVCWWDFQTVPEFVAVVLRDKRLPQLINDVPLEL